MWPEELEAFRPDELKALGINRLDLLGLLPSELEGLQRLSEQGIPDVLDIMENQVGDFFSAASSSVAGWIGKLAGGAFGFLVPGVGMLASGLISAAASAFLDAVFRAFEDWPPSVSDQGMKYKKILLYVPEGGHSFIKPGVWKTKRPDSLLSSNPLEPNNFVTSKSSPYMPICSYYGKNKDGSPRFRPIIGVTREGYALSEIFKGSAAFIGVAVDDEENSLAYEAGASEALVRSTAGVALIAHTVGMPGGFHGEPGLKGYVGLLGRRIMASYAAIKDRTLGGADVIMGAKIWRWIPGFRPLRSGRGGGVTSLYGFRLEWLKEDVKGWFFTAGGYSSRGLPEEPGKVKWISLAVVAAILGAIGFLFSRRKK